MEDSLSLLFHGESRASRHWNFLLRNAGAISLSSNGKSQLAQGSALLFGVPVYEYSSLIQMLLAYQVIGSRFLIKNLFMYLLGRYSLSVAPRGCFSARPRKTAVTTLNLHQCDNNFWGCLSCFPCLQQTKVKNACSDGVCQTRSFEIYYSKTIQQDVRECAVTWLQLFSLIQKHTQDVTTI